MSENDATVGIGVVVDPSGAAPGAKAVADAIGGIGDAAGKVEAKTDGISVAMAKVAASQDSPRALGRAILALTVEIEKAEKGALKGGQAIGGPLKDQIDKARQAADQATQRFGELRETQEKISKSSKLNADTFESLAGAMKSPEAMLKLLSKAGGGWGAALGAAGVAGVVAIEGFKLLAEGGKLLKEAVDKAYLSSMKHAEALAEQKAKLVEMTNATAAAEKGFINFGGSMSETVKNFNDLAISHGRMTAAMKQQIIDAGIVFGESFEKISARAETMAAKLTSEYSLSTAAGNRMAEDSRANLLKIEEGYRRAGEAVPPAIRKAIDHLRELDAQQKKNKESMDALNKAHADLPGTIDKVGTAIDALVLKYAQRVAKGEDVNKLTAEEQRELMKLGAQFNLTGAELIEYYEKHKKNVQATTEDTLATGTFQAATASLTPDVMAAKFAIDAEADAHKFAAAEAKKHASDVAQGVRPVQDLTGAVQKLGDGLVDTSKGHPWEFIVPMKIEIAAASKEIREALDAQIATWGELFAAQEKVLRTHDKMLDYAANIAAAYRAGTIDLIGYMKAFNQLIEQLQRMPTANAAAKKELEDLIAAISKLRDTASSGPVTKEEFGTFHATGG